AETDAKKAPSGFCPSACRYARLCPAYSESQNTMQQVQIRETVMLGCCRELLALGDFGIWVRFDEIWNAVGRKAKVDARISVEVECPVDSFRGSLYPR